MSSANLDNVIARWVRLGVMFNTAPAARSPDLERLLLDTARVAGENSRAFILAASWLARYGDYVARHRLARLVGDELEDEHRPALGLLLDWARERGPANGARFNLAIAACRTAVAAAVARPLFDVERRNATFALLAERRASDLSRAWRRWAEDFDVKDDALRPAEWVAAHNPALADRALTGGDLLASVLAECADDRNAPVPSESELARRCGASRPAVRDAIRRLRLAGRLRTVRRGRANSVEVEAPRAKARDR